MKWIIGIREFVGRYLLKRKVAKLERQRQVFNFDTARSIGVIFDASLQQNYEKVCKLLNFMIEKKIRVVAIGYIENENAKNMYSYQSGVNFFTSNNLNWCRFPNIESVTSFIDLKLDILIDLTTDSWLPVDYVLALSKAKFKVGRYQNSTTYYDMMIDVSKNPSTDFLITQVKHYLSVINKS
jgi:hypothetical protein